MNCTPNSSSLSYESNKLSDCLTEFSFSEVLNPCLADHAIKTAAVHVLGIVATIFGPLVITGLVGNSIILFLLSTEISRPRCMEIWGGTMCVVDICFLLFVGYIRCLLPKSRAWWGIQFTPVNMKGYMICKISDMVEDAIVGLRVNLLLFWMFEELSDSYQLNSVRRKTRAILLIVDAIVLSLLFSFPTFAVNGLWIFEDSMICSPDPFWHAEYFNFIGPHHLWMVIGMFQTIISFPLILALWLRLTTTKQATDYLGQHPRTADIIGLLRTSMLLETLDSCRNYRVVLSYALSTYPLRLVSFLFRKYVYNVVNQAKTQFETRLFYICALTVTDLGLVFEVAANSVSILWWYSFLPEINRGFHRLVQRTQLWCKKRLFSRRRLVHAVRAGIPTARSQKGTRFYFEEAAAEFGQFYANVKERQQTIDLLKKIRKRLRAKLMPLKAGPSLVFEGPVDDEEIQRTIDDVDIDFDDTITSEIASLGSEMDAKDLGFDPRRISVGSIYSDDLD
ncbi:hypothetical protein FBUS_08170 [Fasciolopsis buskii]|uniref:Uncharacterized protein n=1 Tax=Fasciolopsis buskii TaxID=27845 RepID=A0A8E0VGK5_9TREM|nr:hypothetical protein FBUS_08170 [Fasciolopsis buski]